MVPFLLVQALGPSGISFAYRNSMTRESGFVYFAIIGFFLCMIAAIPSLIYSIRKIKRDTRKAPHIVGTVLSGIALLMGFCFCVVLITRML